MRTNRMMKRAGAGPRSKQGPNVDPEQFKADLMEKAAEIGLNAVGVAPFNEKYQYAEHRGAEVGDRMLVGVLEERPRVASLLPGAQAERGITSVNLELSRMCTELAIWLQERGFRDECQVCVRRCPAGAIQRTRVNYRGVVKSKLNTARCFPVVVQTHGCAVCMKVCPVQKYGLGPVLEEYTLSGKILGKDTDELEGYDFDGRHYGPGDRPQLKPSFFRPPGLDFDASRTTPAAGGERPAFLM
jgi:ferredoxin